MPNREAFPVTVAHVGASYEPCSQGDTELSGWNGEMNVPTPENQTDLATGLVLEPFQPARPRIPQPDQK